MTNVACCCYVIKVFSLDPPHARAEAVIISRLDDAPVDDLHQQGDWNKPGASPPVKQAAVCRGERSEHKLRSRWPQFISSFPPLSSLYQTVVFVLERTSFASSQGLAGISDQRHPAASSPGPKSMSTVKHSAGKVLHNQMGFTHRRFFFLFGLHVLHWPHLAPVWACDLLKRDLLYLCMSIGAKVNCC